MKTIYDTKAVKVTETKHGDFLTFDKKYERKDFHSSKREAMAEVKRIEKEYKRDQKLCDVDHEATLLSAKADKMTVTFFDLINNVYETENPEVAERRLEKAKAFAKAHFKL